MLHTFDYSIWFEKKKKKKKELDGITPKSDEKEKPADSSSMPPLKSDQGEIKEGKGLKILTPNKLYTRLQVLLSQMLSGNDSCKLKNKIRRILYLLYQHNKFTEKVHNNLIMSLLLWECTLMTSSL